MTSELLPQIRRTGKYTPGAGDQPAEFSVDQIAKMLPVLREARLIFGKDGAAALWRKLGLPVDDVVKPAKPDLDAPGAVITRIDLVKRFLEARTEHEIGAKITVTELLKAYAVWASENHVPPMTQATMGLCLNALGVRRTKSGTARYRLDIRLKAQGLPADRHE